MQATIHLSDVNGTTEIVVSRGPVLSIQVGDNLFFHGSGAAGDRREQLRSLRNFANSLLGHLDAVVDEFRELELLQKGG